MQENDMVLNLHGEIPSDAEKNIHIINAEPSFLPHLLKLHKAFPKLRIVLEHATTRAAVEAVKSCGATVACTITAHHLFLTVDDWAGQSFNYCKPVAKFPDDREALRAVIKEGIHDLFGTIHIDVKPLPGHPRFFLGSDSAPHPSHTKSTSTPDQGCAAGVYTSPVLLPLVAHVLESYGALDKLEDFVSTFGRKFYKRELAVETSAKKVTLKRVPEGFKIQESYGIASGENVVPFWAGKDINWKIVEER
ncbi:dihydroorotase [Marasmius sp. AFHP31]|nr:dihydroorotase [Marasmius sp. AFHP31]